MTRYATYAVPVGVPSRMATESARQYAGAVGNRQERSAWNGAIGSLVVRHWADRADALVSKWEAALVIGDVDAMTEIVGEVDRCANGSSFRFDDGRHWIGPDFWTGGVTRWRGLIDAARHAGALEYRSRFAMAVLGMPRQSVTTPGAAWIDAIRQGASRGGAWATYGDTLRNLEARADSVYRSAGVPMCWRCGSCGPVIGSGYCRSCESSMAECTNCSEEIDSNESVDCSGVWCDDCANEHLERCDDCEAWYDPDDGPSCRCITSVINSYGYKPAPLFHVVGNPRDGVVTQWHPPSRTMARYDLVMGIEVEIESDGGNYTQGLRDLSASSWVADGFAYLKGDGSLCDGVEIVTHPASRAAWSDLVKGFADLANGLADNGWGATGNCGIHVHVNRDAFLSVAHLARHGVLWHSWAADLVPICGREQSSYAVWSPEGRAAVVGHATGARHCPRYSPINYQPSATVEVRCFASTLDWNVLAGLIDVVAASVEFAETVTSADILTGRADWTSFVNFTESANHAAANALVMARGGN